MSGASYETVEGEQEPIEHEGLLVKFPFGTEKKTYPFWDSTLREPVDIEYQGTDDLSRVLEKLGFREAGGYDVHCLARGGPVATANMLLARNRFAG